METVVVKAGGDMKADTQKRSWVRGVFGWFAWVWDRFDFWVIHRGERLRPEVREELRKSVEEVRQGKDTSPGFTDVDEAIRWLDSQEV